MSENKCEKTLPDAQSIDNTNPCSCHKYTHEIEELRDAIFELEQTNRVLLKDLNRRCNQVTELEAVLVELNEENKFLRNEVDVCTRLRAQRDDKKVESTPEVPEQEQDNNLPIEMECSTLKNEVAALEKLVLRYQEELCYKATLSSSTSKRRDNDFIRVQEEVLETQAIDSNGVVVSRFTRSKPYPTDDYDIESLEYIDLPSNDWQWIGNWAFEVDRTTDVDGWIYASSLEALEKRGEGHCDRTWSDTVRRRTWRRERMLVSICEASSVANRLLADEHRFAGLEITNKKLTDQLLQAQDQIFDYEERMNSYQRQLQQEQDKIKYLTKQLQKSAPSNIHSGTVQLLKSHFNSALIDFHPVSNQEEDTLDLAVSRSRIFEESDIEMKTAMSEFQHVKLDGGII